MTMQDQTQEVRQIAASPRSPTVMTRFYATSGAFCTMAWLLFLRRRTPSRAFRRRGGAVVLITNAPRPSAPVHRQLLKLGVAPDAFDDVATSGDVTIGLIAERIDDPVLHIGPDRDLSLFDAAARPRADRRTSVRLEGAQYALCTGLRDDVTETLDRLRGGTARHGVARAADGLRQSGHRHSSRRRAHLLRRRAGRRYEALGGSVVYAGKPHAPIYRRALALAERRAAARSTSGGCSRSATA